MVKVGSAIELNCTVESGDRVHASMAVFWYLDGAVLDFETEAVYTVEVTASDGVHSVPSTVVVDVVEGVDNTAGNLLQLQSRHLQLH